MTKIKICGITNLADARCAAEAGADFLGFVFYPPSSRYIEPGLAGEIATTLRAEHGAEAPRFVGVFVDLPEHEVKVVASKAQLDLVQLHGAEPPAAIRACAAPAFKAVRPRTLQEAKEEFGRYVAVATTQDESLPQLLIDAYHSCQKGGTGQRVDPAVARWLARRCCLLLAGGLTPDNVGDAIAQIRPWGVDVSSGVEHAKGIKDHLLVRAFARAVRMADGARDGEPQGGRAENGSAGNERRHAVDLR